MLVMSVLGNLISKPWQLAMAKMMRKGNLKDYSLRNGGPSKRRKGTAGGMERRRQWES